MEKIIFEFIDIEGFRSVVKPFHFNLNQPGLNLIKGTNGAGKTTVFEALVWALFGINLKDTNQDKIPSWAEVRTAQWQGTRVSLTLHKERNTYCVTRHLGYKGLTYDVKGEDYLMLAKGDDERGEKVSLLGDFRNKAKIQEEINNILGVDSKTFMNSILFGQRMAKLVEQDNSDKRQLFETLFETEWVNQAKAKCDKDLTQWNSDLTKLSYDINSLSTGIEHLTDKLSTSKEVLAGFEEGRKGRIDSKTRLLNETIVHSEELDKAFTDLNKKLKALKYDSERHIQLDIDFKATEKQIHQQEIDKVNAGSLRKEYENNVKNLERELGGAENKKKILEDKHIEEECPYCEQELKPGNKLELNHKKELDLVKGDISLIKIALKKAETALKVLPEVSIESVSPLEERLKLFETELILLDETYESYNKLQKSIDQNTAAKAQYDKDILRVQKEIEDIKAEKPPEIDIKNIELRILQEQNKLKTAQQDKLDLEGKIEIAKWWSAKGFSSGGIKAFIFKAMLSQLNQNVKKYGQRLGASLVFSIDLTKASKPFTTSCSIGDKLNKDYKEFSGGQKQRLDIILIFAMYDLISMNTDINLLIMDEVFEGLDEEGETAVFDLIRGKAEEGKSVYIITHSAVLDSLYANTIEFKSVNGNTIIE